METRFRKSSKESNPESVKISQPEDEVRKLHLSSIFTKPKNCCSIYRQKSNLHKTSRETFLLPYILHSSKIRGYPSTKYSSKMLQNL